MERNNINHKGKSLLKIIRSSLSIAFNIQCVAGVLIIVFTIVGLFFPKNDFMLGIPYPAKTTFQLVDDTIPIESRTDIYRNVKLFVSPKLLTVDSGGNSILWIFTLAGLLGYLGITIVITKLLLEFFRSLSRGSPFTKANTSRIKKLGFMLILISIFDWLFKVGLSWVLKGDFHIALPFDEGSSGFYIPLEWINSPILYGLMLLVIAQVFQEGVNMKEEQELTI